MSAFETTLYGVTIFAIVIGILFGFDQYFEYRRKKHPRHH